jgi:hypothetical protein
MNWNEIAVGLKKNRGIFASVIWYQWRQRSFSAGSEIVPIFDLTKVIAGGVCIRDLK